MNLLEPSFLKRLEGLRLASKRSTPSKDAGEHRSSLMGSSTEFADHREYRMGDEPRSLDWNVYARLDRLFVKLFQHEADAVVHVILDASASMGFGSPPKIELAKQLAAGISYIALSDLDRAGALILGGPADGVLMPGRGRNLILRRLAQLDRVQAAGSPDPEAGVRRYAGLQRRPGLVILLSDLLDARYRAAVKLLRSRRHEVWCLHILSPEDLGEGLAGDLELVDSETGARREITASPEVLAAYRKTLAEYEAETAHWCLQLGASLVPVSSTADPAQILLTLLRRRSLLK